MSDDIPYHEFKRYKGYEMFCTYMINKETEKPYARMIVYYKGNEIYKKDLYDEERFTTEDIYTNECIRHIRNRRLNQLLK